MAARTSVAGAPGPARGEAVRARSLRPPTSRAHTAFAVHQIARWIASRDDVPKDIRDRLRGHLTALEGVMVSSGHDWIRDEIEATEAAL